jgi:hypothetical protein
MNFKSVSSIWMIFACLVMSGCSKIPGKLISPTIKIEPSIAENKEVFILKFHAGIHNENSDIALMHVKGAVVFYDTEDKNAKIMALPFELPVILPFETGVIEINRSYSENEIMPLVTLLGSDREKLINEKGIERSLMDDKKVSLEIAEYRKENVLEVLKRKPNEKNR